MQKEISCIMLIDDHHPTNVLHTMVIENCECADEIIIFDNGQDALKYLLMLSTSSHPEDLARAEKEAIVKDYIYKPLSTDILQNVIQKYFNKPIETQA